MADVVVTRKLAAILYADVAEYSRLTGEDEIGTHRQLSAALDSISGTIGNHQGQVVHYAGDAVLADFSSVVAALECAVAIQRDLGSHDTDIPDEQRLRFRIGVNLGEVIVDRDDIYGDGVNVAARLESLAEPGGICISAAVHEQVRGKLELGFEDMGAQEVKNIAEPVRTYRVVPDGATSTAPGTVPKPILKTHRPWGFAALAAVVVVGGILFWQQQRQISTMPQLAGAPETEREGTPSAKEKPSIAVLPFTNMSGDKEQEYFSDGMAEDLITDLTKVSGLFVIARNSTFAYKGQSKDIRVIAKELGARYVIEGSVRKAGGRVRITAQLIDSVTGNHMWADRYDRDLKDIFALQDEVLGKIVDALKITLSIKEKRRLARHETDNPEAYDLYLRGLKQESFFSKEGNLESIRLFERAIELDPSFAIAYAHLAQAYSLAKENRWTDKPEEFSNKALKLAKKAVELDDDLPQAHWALARIVTRPPFRDADLALASLKRVIELDPNYGDGHAFYANTLNYVGRAGEAVDRVKKAMRINPRYPFWYVYVLGQAQYMLTQYEAAIENFLIAIERNPTVAWPHRYLLASYGQLGRLDDAEWEISELESLGQPPTIKHIRENSPFKDPVYLKLYLDGLRKAGVPEE